MIPWSHQVGKNRSHTRRFLLKQGTTIPYSVSGWLLAFSSRGLTHWVNTETKGSPSHVAFTGAPVLPSPVRPRPNILVQLV